MPKMPQIDWGKKLRITKAEMLQGQISRLQQQIEDLVSEVKDLRRKKPKPPDSPSKRLGFRTLNEVSEKTGLSVDRLREICTAGYAPHYMVDGLGDEPLFKWAEFEEWFSKNMISARSGTAMPEKVDLLEYVSLDGSKLPGCLRNVNGLVNLQCSRLTGIYFLCRMTTVVYVGKSSNVISRITTHRAEGTKQFDDIFVLPLPESELAAMEAHYVRLIKPEYNLREDGRLKW